MAQDYNTVSEKTEMGVHVCAFLLLRKTLLEHRSLPLGCGTMKLTQSKCLGC